MAIEKTKPMTTAEALGSIAALVLVGPVMAVAGGLWLGLLWRLATLAWGVWW